MNRERIQAIIDYLRKLPNDRWYFNNIVQSVDDCGTVGCALGHFPSIFPATKWNIHGRDGWLKPRLCYGDREWEYSDISNWLDIHPDLAEKIFLSTYYYDVDYEWVTQEMVSRTLEKLSQGLLA